MAIKYRQELGRPLTYAEGDENFRTLAESIEKTLAEYPTLTAALADDIPDGVVFIVNDGDEAGYWRKDSSDPKGAVFLRRPLKDEIIFSNIKFFDRYDESIDIFERVNQSSQPWGVNLAEIYSAFRYIELYGFDSTKPHKISFFWADRPLTPGLYRLIISYLDNDEWKTAFDYGVNDYELTNNIWYIDYTSGGKRVKAAIDFRYLPPSFDAANLDAAYIFSKNVFKDKEEVEDDFEYIGDQFVSQKTRKYSQFRDIKFFEPFDESEDIFRDRSQSGMEVTLAEIYSSFRGLELIGFDSTKPHRLTHFWVNSPVVAGQYRIIIDSLVSGSWVRVFDYNVINPIIDNNVWDISHTDGEKRIEGWVDLRLIPNSFQTPTLPAAYIFSKNAFACNNQTHFLSKPKAIVSFVFDDARDSDALVKHIFDEYGMPVNFALRTSASLTDVKKRFYYRAACDGHGILAHSVNHPVMSNSNNITETEVRFEMEESKKIIEEFGVPVNGWVTPSSVLSSAYHHLAEEIFSYAYTQQSSSYNRATPTHLLSRISLETDAPLSDIKAEIDAAIEQGLFVTFYGHSLPSTYETDGVSRFTEADLRELLDYCQVRVNNGKMSVKRTDDAIREYYHPTIEGVYSGTLTIDGQNIIVENGLIVQTT